MAVMWHCMWNDRHGRPAEWKTSALENPFLHIASFCVFPNPTPMKHQLPLVVGFSLIGLLPVTSLAQSPPPAVQWRSVAWLDKKPTYGMLNTLTGITYDTNNANNITGVQYAQTPCTGGTTTQDESSEDWWYGHVNVYDANHHLLGYAAYGYSDLPKWSGDFGCKQFPMADIAPRDMDTWEHRRSVPFAMVSFFDPSGHMIWCGTPFIPGVFYGITQAGDGGNIICIGEASVNRTNPSPSLSMPVHYNPMVGNPGPDISQSCESGDFAIKACIAAFALDGTPQWVNMYGATGSPQQAWTTFSRGENIAPVSINGQASLIAVGYGRANPTDAGNSGMVLRMNLNGELIDSPSFYGPGTPGMGTMGIEPDETVWMQCVNVATDDANVQHAVITGAHFEWDGQWTTPTDGSAPQKIFTPESYLLWLTPDDGQPYVPDQVVNTRSGSYLQTNHTAALGQYSTSAKFVHEGSQLNVLWPVMSDYTGPITAGSKSATLKIHKYALDGTPLWSAPVDLGEVRAYDLQADVCPLSDGANFAVLSSRYTPPYNASDVMNYNDDLSPLQKACLTDNFSYDADPGTAVNHVDWSADWIPDLGFWNTDAVVSKLRISDGQQLWQKQFDAEDGAPAECYPGDLKNQECMYRITEADDGGLVVSGNTSHNQDDAYLAKLYPDCQYSMDYTAIDALLDANNEFHVTANTTWSTDMNVHGKVIVEPGAQLTINNGATIRFADSQKRADATRIVVAPGGNLKIDGNALLTSMNATCPGSFWDGILVQGDPHAAQAPIQNLPQGMVTAYSGTIAQARIGCLAANDFLPSGSMADYQAIASGGVVQAKGLTFEDNIRDVLFSPYENHLPNDATHVLSNISSFNSCNFTTAHVLADAAITPANHVTLYGVRGIGFTGCTTGNTVFPGVYEHISDLGTGVFSLNSSFTVMPGCHSTPPLGGSCPTNDVIPSQFIDLSQGIIASSFEPGKTFRMDQTQFIRCVAAVNMRGIQDAAITRCDMDVAEPPLPGWLTYPYGVYSEQCTGYQIDANHFTTTHPGGLEKVGLIINNSGPDPNMVYNNTFDNFTTKASCGAIIEGNNASTNFNDGLEIKCNDFGLDQVNAYDIALTTGHPTIARKQGDAALSNLPEELRRPAGNRFSWNCTGTNPENDIWVKTASNLIEYWYHNENGYHTRPSCYDASFIHPFPAGQPYTDKQEVCPSSFSGKTIQQVKVEAVEADADLAEKESTYTATKDDGNTQNLLEYVSNPGHSSSSVRDALLDAAPAVGVDCFKAAFARLPDLSPWHLTQVLMACSPIQPEVVDLVHTSGLDPFYIQLVDQAQSGDANILSLLESAQSRLVHEKGSALTDLGRYSWLDTLDIGSMLDSLSGWHAQIPAMNSPMTMAGIYMATHSYSDLEALAMAHEADTLKGASFGVLRRYAEVQQTDGWTAPSAATRTWLQGLAPERDSLGSSMATAWLVALGDTLPLEVIVLPDTLSLPKMMRRSSAVKYPVGTLLAAYPNPSNGPIYLVYHLPEGVEHASIRIHDLAGREVYDKELPQTMGVLELQTSPWAAGIYAAELDMDEQRATTIKLAIAKR